MTADEVVALLPRLRLLSYRYSGPRCESDDLVQEAVVALIDGRRHYRNPMVAANSAMKDYRKWCRHRRLPPLDVDVAYEPSEKGEVWWRSLRLLAEEEAVARAVCDDGLTQAEAAVRLGKPASTVSWLWRQVVKRAAERWGLTTEDE